MSDNNNKQQDQTYYLATGGDITDFTTFTLTSPQELAQQAIQQLQGKEPELTKEPVLSNEM